MKLKKFSKKEAISFGWQTMKANFWFLVGILIVAWLILIVIPSLPSLLPLLLIISPKSFLILRITSNFLFQILFWILGIIVSIGLIKIALRFADGEKAKFTDLFSQYRLFFKYLVGSILYSLIVLGGLILLIVPGIIWSIKFMFYEYFIVDKGLGPISALKESSKITKGEKWNLFLFWLISLGIMFLGALALLVGLFAAIPTIMIAWAFVYRKLLVQIETSQPVPEIVEPKIESGA